MAQGLFGASMAGLAVALVDAVWASRAAEQPPGLGATWGACAGLVAVVAWLVGGAVSAASLLLHPAEPPGLSRLVRWAGAGSQQARAERAALLLLASLAVPLFVFASASIALASFLGEGSPRHSGVAVGLGAAAVAAALGLIVLGGARALAVRRPRFVPSPLVAGAIGVGLAVAMVASVIAAGSESGSGGSFAMFGVLKRDELDLRAPGLVIVVALGAYGAPALVRRAPAWMLLVVALLPVTVLLHAMTRGLETRQLALAVERGAPLSRLALGPLRKLTDADRDGAARYFGGGDCNDADPTIYPGADDIPGDGIDQDCSGADAEPVVLEEPAVEAPEDAAAWVQARLPENVGVVMLSIDALRWDAAGFMGYSRKTTPRLDALAARSVVFERAYALASYTSKSIPPMLIGKYSSETDRGWEHFNRISAKDTTVQQRLQRAGVRTLTAQGYWYFYKESHGFHRGWDVNDSSAAPAVMQIEGDKGVTSDKLADAAIRILSDPDNTRGSFFFWSHYVDPHADYIKHEGFDFGASDRDRYDSELAFVDHHVGRVLDFIGQSDLAKRTVIIITSDHGEAFGEHGMIRHGFEVWEPLVRVPLVIHVPGVEPHRVAARRGLIDLVPTLLELFRLAPPSGEGTDFVSGQSWLFDVFRPPGHEPAERIVLVDMTAGPNNAERQAFYEGSLKLIASGGRPLGLYDVDADPGEKKDLLDDASLRERIVPRYQELRRRLRVIHVKPIPK